jgi:mannose-1-phosphate guanylyltransferase/mannose-1-phosphate guanylyltransferase/mannose-6-phosphate isomerase
MSDALIVPVIMSGGAGSRLWPLSRQAMPKQLLPLVTEKTMIQETVARLDKGLFSDPVFICNGLHAGPIQSQMQAINMDVDAVIVEPVGRNTAPVAVVAACHAMKQHPDSLVLLAPADHHVTDPKAFNAAIRRAIPAAKDGHLVTFGIMPDGPETGYGYIQQGAEIHPDVFGVKAFREKPDQATAQSYIDEGTYAWNAGIFLFSPAAFLEEIDKFASGIKAAASEAYEKSEQTQRVLALDKGIFEACPSESIDYAVMEKTTKAAVVPCSIGWNDIGSFASLHSVRQSEGGTVIRGDVLTEGTENCLIQTDGPLVSAVGVSDLAIIVHNGKILVSKLSASQDVKNIVNALKADNRQSDL